jgi:hypothetical protein
VPKARESVATALFNNACEYGLDKKTAQAISTLERWKNKIGKIDCEKIRNDHDFDLIRDDPAFVAWLTANGCGTETAPQPPVG